MLEEKEVKLEFLPPYSPDYNPIEYSFSVIKQALKGTNENYRIRGDESLKELADKVLLTAMAVVTPEIARNQFRHCHIRVDYN